MKRFLAIGMMMYLWAMNSMAQGKICIAENGKAKAIVVDENDWPGVIRAAHDLGNDVECWE